MNNTTIEQHTQKTVNITINNRAILLLGTAHISKESVQDIRDITENSNIDSIAVELDENRYKRITKHVNDFADLDIFTIIKKKKAMLFLSTIVLSAFQRRLGSQLDIAPGADMITAIEESKRLNIPCHLVDRAVDVTLKRAWSFSSFWDKQKIIVTIISMIFSKEKVSEEELQNLKERSLHSQIMDELSKFMPKLKKVLVDERDEYLACKIFQIKNKHVLVVLGAAHVPGVLCHLQEYKKIIEEKKKGDMSARLAQLNEVPKVKIGIMKFIIPAAIIALFVWGFIKGGADTGLQNIISWYLINGILSLAGALFALAHPLTMVLAFVAAPLTSINPFIGVGMLTGLSEAFLRKPRGSDIEELPTLKLSLKTLYKNRVTRTLLVVFLTTLGSAIGTFLGLSILTGTNIS